MNFEEFEIDLDDLITAMGDNIKEDLKNFDDFINLVVSVDREIYLGDITEGVGSSISCYIRFWNKIDDKNNIKVEDRKPIKIYIDSNGGYLGETLTMIDAIKMSRTPVWTICTGSAYSGGFFVFISGHKRIAYPHATFLFHEGSTANEGTSGQFENFSVFYKKRLESLKYVVINNSNISEEEYQSIKRDDIWYFAAEGVEKGFIDEIASEFI